MKFLGDHRPKPVHHRYKMNGMPRNCAYCRDLCKEKFGDTGSNTFAPNFASRPHRFSHGPRSEVAYPTVDFHPRKFGGASGRPPGGHPQRAGACAPPKGPIRKSLPVAKINQIIAECSHVYGKSGPRLLATLDDVQQPQNYDEAQGHTQQPQNDRHFGLLSVGSPTQFLGGTKCSASREWM